MVLSRDVKVEVFLANSATSVRGVPNGFWEMRFRGDAARARRDAGRAIDSGGRQNQKK